MSNLETVLDQLIERDEMALANVLHVELERTALLDSDKEFAKLMAVYAVSFAAGVAIGKAIRKLYFKKKKMEDDGRDITGISQKIKGLLGKKKKQDAKTEKIQAKKKALRAKKKQGSVLHAEFEKSAEGLGKEDAAATKGAIVKVKASIKNAKAKLKKAKDAHRKATTLSGKTKANLAVKWWAKVVKVRTNDLKGLQKNLKKK